ncbi:MetQ/NlpA family ABC transporter substrate-binding protein, partial [Streptococcus pyogenes]
LISPLRIFSGLDGEKVKYKTISELPDGAVISVPNDPTNESRALYLLQTAGLIKLNVSGEELATIVNISENPKKLDIKELDAS